MTPWPPPLIVPAKSAKLIGYARVSTTDQRLDMQLDALAHAGCDAIYKDHGECAGWCSGSTGRTDFCADV